MKLIYHNIRVVLITSLFLAVSINTISQNCNISAIIGDYNSNDSTKSVYGFNPNVSRNDNFLYGYCLAKALYKEKEMVYYLDHFDWNNCLLCYLAGKKVTARIIPRKLTSDSSLNAKKQINLYRGINKYMDSVAFQKENWNQDIVKLKGISGANDLFIDSVKIKLTNNFENYLIKIKEKSVNKILIKIDFKKLFDSMDIQFRLSPSIYILDKQNYINYELLNRKWLSIYSYNGKFELDIKLNINHPCLCDYVNFQIEVYHIDIYEYFHRKSVPPLPRGVP